eukprot:CAMPEP_0113385086 /NCGR_PEP_ID=MMETSP0013_2-20120614/7272_1 /TAXON_ID=2843 ORGANISM="Skeletonema costatum, Strain 1716" /NCGR_SAMPLE_ID=MMETSP0013_2 /ASSEMBLY_ACC=CAM_ASM_000158 /LENGTH=566 /DNA_ID=CAMNT_0000267805 /DNA_START=65 /DNA_END=1765 /DNA_ORIENTATION=- /assembly_acc=CAM_ASM_000158
MDNVTIDRGDADPTDVINSAATSRRGRKVQVVAKNTIILLVIALSATALLQSQYVSKNEFLGRIYTARETLSSQSMAVSGWVNRLPQVIDTRRTMIIEAVTSPITSNTNVGGGRAASVTTEGADMVREKSQSLLRQLHRPSDVKKGGATAEENVLHRALEGIQGIFNKNKKEGGQKHVINGAKKDQIEKMDDLQGHRRLKAIENEELQTPSNQDLGRMFFDIQSTISNSPIAAAVLIFCGIAFLIASVAMASDDSRRLRRLANSHENRTIVLDEEEAEIVEFYEKEMESGMMQSFPFLEDDCHVDDCREDDAGEEQKRSQSFIRRPSSDSSLNRHLSGEARVSQCDSYYSRVLQDITSFDEGGDDPEDEEDSCLDEIGEPCQDEREEGESSPRDEAEEVAAEPDARLAKEDEQLNAPTHAQNSDEDADADCSSSPTSSESSISSLTSEMYADIESPPPQQPQELGQISSSSNATSSPSRTITRKRRSVSFSPQVKVREIPRQVNSEMSSSEKYLYLMLFTVAIVITFCSLLPAPHPSLSVPISDLTAGEMIQRADTILKSQWEVEL